VIMEPRAVPDPAHSHSVTSKYYLPERIGRACHLNAIAFSFVLGALTQKVPANLMSMYFDM
jgi:hypothetical protein